jgi:hypothetical protein
MGMSVEEVDEILGNRLRLYEELANACSQATDLIRAGDLDGLGAVTRRQHEIIMAIAEHERTRTGLLRECSGDTAEAHVTLQFIEEPYASQFADHDERLQHVVDEIRTSSERNRFLLACSLELVDRAVRSLGDRAGSNGAYDPSGPGIGDWRPAIGLFDKEA